MRTEIRLSVFESIMERIKRDIALGIIAKNEKLPSCRDLAIEMGVNPNTVQHAYSALEEQGVIYSIPKKGVYSKGVDFLDAYKEAEKSIRAIKAAGISRSQLEKIISEEYSEGNQ